MDYPDGYAGRSEGLILPAFLRGYQSIRPFTGFQRQMFPYLYALIDAFWSMDIVWSENSLQKAFKTRGYEGGGRLAANHLAAHFPPAQHGGAGTG